MPPDFVAQVAARPRNVDPGTIRTGDVIAERYIVDAMIGRGGMGMVFRVTDQMLEEPVALKIFDRSSSSRDTDLARFKDEMKICRRLAHENIVNVFEFGAWAGNWFLTMELLQGRDLEAILLGTGGPLPLTEALPLMIQACDGLGAAHRAGVVHRDVKPPNLFVIEEGRKLKVMDFGIAKAGRADVGLTQTGTLVGSPAYIAPERLHGEGKESPASDLYALGVVIYQLVTGVLPFQAREMPVLFMQHLQESPIPPSRRNPVLTPDVDAVVLKLLEKDPERRFRSCIQLRKALERLWRDALRAG